MICCSWIYFVPICACMCNQKRLGGQFHHLYFACPCVCLHTCVCSSTIWPPRRSQIPVEWDFNHLLLSRQQPAAGPAQPSYIYDNFCCSYFASVSLSLALFFYWNHCWLKDVILISGGCVATEGWKALEPCWFTGTERNWKGETVWNASWIRHCR